MPRCRNGRLHLQAYYRGRNAGAGDGVWFEAAGYFVFLMTSAFGLIGDRASRLKAVGRVTEQPFCTLVPTCDRAIEIPADDRNIQESTIARSICAVSSSSLSDGLTMCTRLPARRLVFSGHDRLDGHEPPQNGKRKIEMTVWSAPMYSAFGGV